MRIKSIFAAAALLFAGLFTTAEAAPITYEMIGQFDGSVGATNFTGGTFLWTITGDTSSAFNYAPGILGIPAFTSQIDFGGGLVVTTTTPMAAIFAPMFAEAVFGDPFSTEGMVFGAPSLGSYNGLTAFGPTSVFLFPFTPIHTDQGDWNVTSVTGGGFAAVGGSVPEPITLALFGAGLAGVGAMRRKRKALA